jgi:AraC-like DNA-binding protein
MDVVDELLSGVRGRGSVFGRTVLRPPWSLRFSDAPYLTLCLPLRGSGWIVPSSGAPRRIGIGDAAIVRGPEPFLFTDDPSTSAPELDVRGLSGVPAARELSGPRGARDTSEANEARGARDTSEARGAGSALAPLPDAGELTGRTVLLAGSYDVRAEVPRRLLRVLPPLLVLPDEEDCTPLRDYLEAQIAGARPGHQTVLDRLLDWLLVCTLRDWFDRPEAEPPQWYAALGDDVVGPALRALHEDPALPWTTASLAARAGVSRTTLAKRFTELVGEGPVSYLTGWRMTLAADLLARPELTVAAVARRVGYADAFGFSAAFKRVRGVSPTAYRQGLATAGPDDRAPREELTGPVG